MCGEDRGVRLDTMAACAEPPDPPDLKKRGSKGLGENMRIEKRRCSSVLRSSFGLAICSDVSISVYARLAQRPVHQHVWS